MPMNHAELIANLPNEPDVIAPDGSEIRFLESSSTTSSMVHALLHPGTTTHAVHHLTVEESWFCVAGEGELWRKDSGAESVLQLAKGTTCDIPLGTSFQFRATGDSPLEIVITTTPPWPGDHEAVRVEGTWEPSV
jgi:mannose-6-phosphate isomerase-like protein (cupin superfamily)